MAPVCLHPSAWLCGLLGLKVIAEPVDVASGSTDACELIEIDCLDQLRLVAVRSTSMALELIPTALGEHAGQASVKPAGEGEVALQFGQEPCSIDRQQSHAIGAMHAC